MRQRGFFPSGCALFCGRECSGSGFRAGVAGACSSVAREGFSSGAGAAASPSFRAVTGAEQMGQVTWRPRKDVSTAKRLPHDGQVQATVSWDGEGMSEKRSYRWMNSGTGMLMGLGAGSVMFVSAWSWETGSAERACASGTFSPALSNSKLRLAGAWFTSVW